MILFYDIFVVNMTLFIFVDLLSN